MALKAAIQPIKYVLANFFHCEIIFILTINTIGQISGVETRDLVAPYSKLFLFEKSVQCHRALPTTPLKLGQI